jgi:hypothetical protein
MMARQLLPEHQFQVEGDSSSGVGVYGYSATWNGVVGQNTRTDWTAAAVAAIPGNSNGLAIWAGGGAQKPGGGSWAATSDVRVKKDVKDFRPGLAELKRIRPVSYKYNGLGKTQDDGNEFVGVIAQELEKVLPSMVTSHKGKLRPGDSKETDIEHVDPSAFTYVLINAFRNSKRSSSVKKLGSRSSSEAMRLWLRTGILAAAWLSASYHWG